MPSDLPIVIAAAGVGSRLGSGKPKALLEIGGRTIIERMLTDCLADERDVRIVVGFQEHELINHVLSLRKDIIFIRNPDYRDCVASNSYALAARSIEGSMIVVDGDLLIDPSSWQAFVKATVRVDTAATSRDRFLIGITPAKTEDAVFVHTRGDGSEIMAAERFTRTNRQLYEWCGIACVHKSAFDIVKNYTYECLERSLPLPAFVLDVAEIDTPADFAAAQLWLTNMNRIQSLQHNRGEGSRFRHRHLSHGP